MPKNGSANGQNGESIADEIFGDVEFDLDLPSTAYLGYEQVVGTLMWACIESELMIYGVENKLETATLEREFRGLCVPADWERPFHLYAEIEFAWPTEYTVLSISGDEGLCALYHREDEPCMHQDGGAQPFIELEVHYKLPQAYVERLDSDEGIEDVARRVRAAFAEIVDHDNIVQVDARASFLGERLALTEIKAWHFWHVEEELQDLPTLGKVFLSLTQEIREVLNRFAQEFPPGRMDDS